MGGAIGCVTLVNGVVELVVANLAGTPIGNLAIGLIGITPIRMHGQGAIGAGQGSTKSAGSSSPLRCSGPDADNIQVAASITRFVSIGVYYVA